MNPRTPCPGLEPTSRPLLLLCRRAIQADVPAIVDLQTICLPHFYLPDPGREFLRSFYSCLLRDRRGLLFVSDHDGRLAGFVAGFFDPARLYRVIAPQRLRAFVAASGCLVGHPIQLRRFLSDLRRARRFDYPPDEYSETACELVTIAIQPRLRRRGYGRACIQALFDTAACNGAAQVRVHISSNDAPMAAFYRNLGFAPFRAFTSPGGLSLDGYVLAIKRGTKPR